MFSVLYTDDEKALLDIGKTFLEREGIFTVDTATSAPAALDLLASHTYDAIISDYLMPGMDGIEFLKRVRGSGNTIPFILFTGKGREEVVIQALNEGADFYLQKGGDIQPQFVELSHKVRLAVQQRLAEAALEESEERYRAVVEDQTELICRFTSDGLLTFVNDAYCRFFELDRSRCLNNPHDAQLFPEDARRMKEHLAALTPEQPVALIEHRIRAPDGTIRWQRWSDRAIYGKDGRLIEYQSVGRDISEQKLTEERLLESESRFVAFMDNLPAMAFIKDQECKTLFINRELEEQFGAAEWIGKKPHETFPAPAADRILSDDLRTLKEGRVVTIENLPEKNGRMRTFETHKFRIDRGGNSPLIGGFALDITERRQSETALKESEAGFRNLFNHTGDAIAIHILGGCFTEVNDEFCRRLSYTREELLTMRPQDIEDAESAHLAEARLAALKNDEHTVFEAIMCAKDGTKIPTEINSRLITYHGQQAVISSGRDITERKRADDALRQANRQLTMLTSITRHDINNQIMIILAHLSMARMESPSKAQAELISKVEAAITTIRTQIEFTRVYQNLGSHQPQWLAVSSVLRYIEAPKPVVVKTDLAGVEIYADSMIQKVFFNLLDNAIRHGGKVTEVRIGYHQEGDSLILTWEDNGVGIRAEEKDLVFARGYGKNTGLGLFLVREILSLTGMTIKETGVAGEGARFEIQVPKGTWRIARR
ncbi:MAG: PAS domain S-box protein [Methanomicrobiales archaeon]|nr:PAS domain S-box protein [Methanomicrobiales archaeon]